MTNTSNTGLTKNLADDPPRGKARDVRTGSRLVDADCIVSNIPPRTNLSRTQWRPDTPPSLALARYLASLA